MSNVFSGKKLIKSILQAPNLERLLCKSKFIPVKKNFSWILVERTASADPIC